jgi:hypothetical protein
MYYSSDVKLQNNFTPITLTARLLLNQLFICK